MEKMYLILKITALILVALTIWGLRIIYLKSKVATRSSSSTQTPSNVQHIFWNKDFQLKKGQGATTGETTITFLDIRISPLQRLPNGIEIFPKSYFQFMLEQNGSSQKFELDTTNNVIQRDKYSLTLNSADDKLETVNLTMSAKVAK
jgi:hypothetical protein